MFSRFILICFFLCFFSYGLKAQDSISTITKADNFYPQDLDSVKVDSFFKLHSIDLAKCEQPEMYYEIYRWYRTCYKYGGNTSNGIDCSHFVNMLYEKTYGYKLNNSSSSIFNQCQVVKGGFDNAKEGDLVFFKIKKRRISHIAIYLQNGQFAHATTQAGVIISGITEPYYKRHFFKVGRCVK